jgi:adenosylmethionine-8-amino-7-oxononanoate aminotransferase
LCCGTGDGIVNLTGFAHLSGISGLRQVTGFQGLSFCGNDLKQPTLAQVDDALATLSIYREEGLLTRASEIETYWHNAVHSLKGLPNVTDIRTIGLIAGIELDSRAGVPGSRAYDAFVDCFERGLLIRVTGDIIALSPPLIIETSQIDAIVETLADALNQVA